RAAKYFTPIAVIGLVWGAKLAWQRGGGTAIVWRSRALTIVAGLVCLALNRGTLQTLSQISCSTSSLLALPCQSARDRADITAMYRAIEREVPKRERVFLDNAAQQYFSGGLFSYGVRIYSRRPVAWSWKEGGFLIFTNPAGLVEWYQRWRTLRAIRHLTGEEKSSAFTRLMRQWNVHYVVLDASKPLGPLDVPGRVLHANARAVLMELTPAPLRIIRNASASAGP
ncbi:MAG TPA: hypothetical protein VFB54_20205, partial [Burkholderiales bacterium]|nr:hypothetical protein [Burkholderiales bacterium]